MCSETTASKTHHHHQPLLSKFVSVDFSPGETPPATDAQPPEPAAYEKETPDKAYQVLTSSDKAVASGPLTGSIALYSAQIGETIATSAIREAQSRIIEKYGEMSLSIDPLGVFKHGREGDGFIPSHAFAMIEGYGLAMARLDGPHQTDPATGRVVKDLSEPDLLFYAPKDPSRPEKKEYILIGWGWFSDYEPGKPPLLEGVSDQDWFLHESGWHTADGGFVATPPNEDYPGQVAAPAPTRQDNPPGKMVLGAHARMWDFHFWRTDLITKTASSLPVAQMEVPDKVDASMLPKDMLKLDGSAFFYPDSRTFEGPQEE